MVSGQPLTNQYMMSLITGRVCLLFLREAAEDAGFDVLRIISQPAAAALAYGK